MHSIALVHLDHNKISPNFKCVAPVFLIAHRVHVSFHIHLVSTYFITSKFARVSECDISRGQYCTNAAVFVALVPKLMQWSFKVDHYSMHYR